MVMSNGHLDNDDGCVGKAVRVPEGEHSLSAQTYHSPSLASEQNWKLKKE